MENLALYLWACSIPEVNRMHVAAPGFCGAPVVPGLNRQIQATSKLLFTDNARSNLTGRNGWLEIQDLLAQQSDVSTGHSWLSIELAA